MSAYNTTISEYDRTCVSVQPPPVYRRDGTLCSPSAITDEMLNAQRFKERNVVYIDEELDAYDHPGSLSHYRMMIRCLPFKADLNIIMCAARHMNLLHDFYIKYEQSPGLNPDLESGYWDIQYTIATEEYPRDAEVVEFSDVYIPYSQRRRIWIEMFTALGHKVKWGNTVLNVRKRK